MTKKETAIFARFAANMLCLYNADVDGENSRRHYVIERRGEITGYHGAARALASTMGISHSEVVSELGLDLDLMPLQACEKLRRWHDVPSLKALYLAAS